MTQHANDVLRHDIPTPWTAATTRPYAPFIPLNAGATLKGLNQQILTFFDHPAAKKAGNRTQLTEFAVDSVISCQTKLIVIDDLHFIDFRHRDGIEVSNHLKSLANALPVTFIYVGVNLQAKLFFDEGLAGEQAVHAQMSRRATRCPVSPFGIDNDAGARAWTDLLATLEQHLVLADAQPGMLTTHAKELHRRTQGRIASLTNLIDRAAYLAITTGTETITREVLDTARADNAAQRLAGTA